MTVTDYVGCVQYVTELLQSTKTTKEATIWRDIGIQNLEYVTFNYIYIFHTPYFHYDTFTGLICNRGMTVRFTLWNEKARDFNMKEYEESEKPVTIAVSSCIVKTYGGKQTTLYLSSHVKYTTNNCYITLYRPSAFKHSFNLLLFEP